MVLSYSFFLGSSFLPWATSRRSPPEEEVAFCSVELLSLPQVAFNFDSDRSMYLDESALRTSCDIPSAICQTILLASVAESDDYGLQRGVASFFATARRE